MSYYYWRRFLLKSISDERQARLKEAETLGRRQESEVLIFTVKISNISVINTINITSITLLVPVKMSNIFYVFNFSVINILPIYRIYQPFFQNKSHLSLQVTTAEGLVGAWLGVTARLNFRFIFILAPIIIDIIVIIISLSSVTDTLYAQAVHHHQQGYMNAGHPFVKD